MATFVLIHGAGSDSWYWHLVVPRLRDRGHDVVTVDLPCDDDDDPFTLFLHDLPPELAAEAMTRSRDQSGTPFEKPWPKELADRLDAYRAEWESAARRE